MYRFLSVCAYGVSSSIILKKILQKTVQDVSEDKGIEANVESMNLLSAKETEADAIFTNSVELSKELQSTTNAPVYQIKNISDEEEVAKAVEDFLKYYVD